MGGMRTKIVLSEMMIIAVCAVAAGVGPWLFGVKVSVNHFMFGLRIAFFFATIFWLIATISRTVALPLPATLFLGHAPLVLLGPMVVFGFVRLILTGPALDLVSSPGIGFFYLLLIAFLVFRQPLIQAVSEAGLYFLLPLLIAGLFVRAEIWTPNSEGKVIMINLAMIYFWLRAASLPFLKLAPSIPAKIETA